MKPYYDDGQCVIYNQGALSCLQLLAPESVQMCVTSPPYWGLRDYGVEGQLGLQKTPEEFVAKLVAIFREVHRVLKNDGTIWVNLGDSYAGSGKGGNPEAGKQATNLGSQSIGVLYETGRTAREAAVTNVTRLTFPESGIKAKDLVGIPWMVAFALRADGWYLRQDIIWHKPNAMPESVKDRCTKAHEYVFLLSKSARYFYDLEAIQEPDSGQNGSAVDFKRLTKDHLIPRQGAQQHRMDRISVTEHGVRNKRSVWPIPTASFSEAHFATFPPDLIKPCILAGSKHGDTVLDPFFGSGTSGMVSVELGRRCIGIELNPDYCAMAQRRVQVTPGLPLA